MDNYDVALAKARCQVNHLLWQQGWLCHARWWTDPYPTEFGWNNQIPEEPKRQDFTQWCHGWCFLVFQHPRSVVSITALLWQGTKPKIDPAELRNAGDLLIYENLVARVTADQISSLVNRAEELYREISVMNRFTNFNRVSG